MTKEYGLECTVGQNPGGCPDFEVMFCCSAGKGLLGWTQGKGSYDCEKAHFLAQREAVGTAGNDIPCSNPCGDGTHYDYNQTECATMQYCQSDGTRCVLKLFPDGQQQENDFNGLLAGVTVSETTTEGVEGRLFGLPRGPPPSGDQDGPLPPPNFPPIQPPSFPDNCGINPEFPDPYLFRPPIDIPYCYRVPCSTSDPTLKFDQVRCHNQPGCYYDLQLANLRSRGGPNILPGVPVCQKVIRHKNFAPKAIAAMKGQPWQGAYTYCFLTQNPDLFDGGYCCDGIRYMKYFGVSVKRLGWTGVNEGECLILGGCWVDCQCYYEPSNNQIQLSADDDPHRSSVPNGRDIYGQPQCLPFDPNGSPSSILNSYHQCRLAGCVMDPEYNSQKLRDYLCAIAESDAVPANLKQRFWTQVLQGIIGPHNWQEILQLMSENICPNVGSNPPFNQRFSLPGCTNIYTQFSPTSLPTGPNPNPHSNLINQLSANLGPTTSTTTTTNTNTPVSGRFYNNQHLQNQNYPHPQYPQPQCPYKPYAVQGYAPLQGSFTGCCERHYCYVPRAQASSGNSGVSPYWSMWSDYGKCSVSCGGGNKTRSRTCVGGQNNDDCGSDNEQTRVCSEEACPFWDNWGQWDQCSELCNGGTRSRRRQCLPSGSGCSGSGIESEACNTCTCPSFSGFSDWTTCNVTIGCGTRSRSRTCEDPGTCAAGCATIPTSFYEEEDCIVYCGDETVTKTECTFRGWGVGCKQTVSTSCDCAQATDTCKLCIPYTDGVGEISCTCPGWGK
uniref:Uncharacterized protein LOC100180672 n=1 Tax=Phallusia mammillata TaxID=59560 RepID=A0A6F9DHY8_9ASCI|nr:uncharacterized protein LOC100180672 [Phallusia mammillata]